MTSITIDAVNEHEIPDVLDIERRSFTDPWSPRAFREIIDNPRVFFAGARDAADGPLLGYVVAWFVIDEGEIANLAVAPETRGRGIGSALLDAALAEAATRGVTAVYLEVRDSNRPARLLYGSRGFVEVGRRKKYYRRPLEDAIVLRRSLEGRGSGV